MSCSVNSLFKCPETLKKLNNSGCFSQYPDHFADWMAKDRFSDFTMRFHISNVAHFSHSLKGTDPEINNLDCHIRSFCEHIPTCHCKGWKKPRKIKYVCRSLNRFKTFLFVSRMIEQGESFKHIADLAGHKHIQTTFIYTKIDFNSLAEVALELPEVRYENN